jgi:putative ABC transport system permease protein
MLRNFIKIAFRNLLRHKLYSLANIVSFSIGLASVILVSLYVLDEYSFDTFQQKYKQTYRVVSFYNKDSTFLEDARTPFPLGKNLQTDFHEMIESQFRLFNFQNPSILVEYKDKHFNEKNFFVTDTGIFSVFNFEFISRAKNYRFDEINTVVISESIKKKYFGHLNPIGKELLIDGIPVKVSGVYKDLPKNSHVRLDILVSFSTLEYLIGYVPDIWMWNSCWTYVVLKPGFTQADLGFELPAFVQKHYDATIKNNTSLFLQPLPEIHLNSSLEYEINPNNKKLYLHILIGLSGFILLVSVINFLSLRITDSLARVKESGIRKILGSNRFQLLLQFIIESLILSLMAMFMAFFLVEASLPVLNHITGKQLIIYEIFRKRIFVFSFLMVSLTGILVGAGSGMFASACPAIYATSFKKSAVHRRWRSGRFFILVQYTLALVLLIIVLVNFRQLHYLKNTDLGFEVRNTVILPVYNTPLTDKYANFKKLLLQNKNVEHVTALDNIIGNRILHKRYFYKKNNYKKVEFFPVLAIRNDFLHTFNIELLSGKDFSIGNELEISKNELLINETLSKLMGFKSVEDAINKPLSTFNGEERIIGVIKDFNIRSLHKPISPLIIRSVENKKNVSEYTRYVAIKYRNLKKQDFKTLYNIWRKIAPDYPFEFGVLNSILNKQYKNEDTLNYFLWLFSILLIVISLIGVWVLTSFIARQRTKEIGIRKAIGALEQDVLKLFTKDSLHIILIANVIAWPLAYIIINKWLSVFAFRTDINLWIFIFASVLMLFLTFSVVWFYALRIASSNPVDSLRDE